MKTTGSSATDNLLKTESGINSNHSVYAEFNMNSFFSTSYYGSYKTPESGSLTTTYDPDNVDSLYDDGISQVRFSNVDEDNKERKNYTPLKDCFLPNRPDCGILRPVALLGHQKTLVDTSGQNKMLQTNYPNADARVYPLSENAVFKYWNSLRKVGGQRTGVSKSDNTIDDTIPFVVYDTEFNSNKITIKTQKESGYPTSFKVEYLNEGSWVTAFSANDSTHFSDGQLSISYSNGTWSVSDTSVDSYVTDFNKNSTKNEFVSMNGIRFVVTKMSTEYIPLELIEISPRLVADLSSYSISFNVSQSIGDDENGIPIGSVVSSTGSIVLSNDNSEFDRTNSNSIFTYADPETLIFQTMLGQNVKFTIYQNVINSETMYKVKIATLYSTSWTQEQDYTVNVSLEDYFKFFREQKAPNLLLGFNNPLKASVAIRMLLDNIGFNKFLFNKDSALGIDPTLKFFYCSNNFTIGDVMNDLAKSLQLSMHFDSENRLSVFTKEKIVEKSSKTYWFKGNKAVTGDDEKTIVDTYNTNIESFQDDVVYPITSAKISYKILDIKKEYTGVLDYTSSENFKATFEELQSNPEIALTKYSYVNDIVWQTTESDNSSVLLKGVLSKDISDQRLPLTTSVPSASSSNDATAKLFASLSSANKELLKISISKSDLILFSQSGKFNGYIYVDNELIKYNGILFSISSSTGTSNKIIFNSEELEALKIDLPSGATFLPIALIINLEYKNQGTSYTLTADGRAQEGTSVAYHTGTRTTLDSKWTDFSNMMLDAGLNELKNTKATATLTDKLATGPDSTGYLKLEGPALSNKDSGIEKKKAIKNLPIKDYGQRFIHGKKIDLSFKPQIVGAKMKLLRKDASDKKDVSMHTAGIAFSLTDAGTIDGKYVQGYFLEVSANDDTDEANNLRLYRLATTVDNVEVKLLGAGFVGLTSTLDEMFIQDAAMDNGRISQFDLQVRITKAKKKNHLTFRVYWQSKLIFKITDTNPIKWTSSIGMFVRKDSIGLFDYIYAFASEDSSAIDPNDILYDDVSNINKALGLAVVPETSNKKTFFQSFGTIVREAVKITAKFDTPVFTTEMIDLSDVNPQYLVKDYKPNPFGATFWVYNTSSSHVILDSANNTPLYIAGTMLDYRSDAEISYDNIIDKDETNEKRKILNKNRKLYGETSTLIQTEYMASRKASEELLDWIFNNSLKEKRRVVMDVFPNPLIEVGDKVGVFYSNVGYSIDNIGDKTYIVGEISRTVDENGPVMNITLREC